jgi:hypothetical protein
MAIVSALSPEVLPVSVPLTADERWRCWEQRGREQDARFRRTAGRVFWIASILLALSGLFLVGR